jgi:DUF1365 family protein
MQRFERSCLYSCEIIHERVWPKHHDFSYNVFMFYLDLGELDTAHKKLRLFSRNRFNWFSYADKDHTDLSAFLRSKGIEWNGRATLLTNCRTFGYVFNPISFYFCFDSNNEPVCAIAEVTNTHKERKLYLLDKDCFDNGTFSLRTPKYFYVSPFSDLDTEFEFNFKIPSATMQMRVDDYKNGDRILLSALNGKRKELSDANLLLYGLRFPFITLQVIGLIYWQAFKLKLKGLPFWKKKENPNLQKDFITTV